MVNRVHTSCYYSNDLRPYSYSGACFFVGFQESQRDPEPRRGNNFTAFSCQHQSITRPKLRHSKRLSLKLCHFAGSTVRQCWSGDKWHENNYYELFEMKGLRSEDVEGVMSTVGWGLNIKSMDRMLDYVRSDLYVHVYVRVGLLWSMSCNRDCPC